MLKQFGIEDRTMNNENVDKIFNNMGNNINYEDVYKKIEGEKNKSLEYLKENIG